MTKEPQPKQLNKNKNNHEIFKMILGARMTQDLDDLHKKLMGLKE